jgi:hypothetical protein
MIFRCILPDEIISHKYTWDYRSRRSVSANIDRSLFMLNRQIYEEASSILYGEATFHAAIDDRSIAFMGKLWPKDSPQRYAKLDGPADGLASTLFTSAARKIRNISVSVETRGHGSQPGSTMKSIPEEESLIVSTRDTIRKFVELVNDEATPKKLKVTPKIYYLSGWKMREITAAIYLILEPLEKLHCDQAYLLDASVWLDTRDPPRSHPGIKQLTIGANAKDLGSNVDFNDYIDFQREWPKIVCGSKSRMAIQSKVLFKQQENARPLLDRIEEVIELIMRQGLSSSSRDDPKRSSILYGIERPLHLARVAYENVDVESLRKIRDALLQRWIDYHRKLQNQSVLMAEAVEGMFTLDG